MFQRYLVLEGVITRDRVQLARSPKLWNTLPDVLNVDEVTKLLLSAAEGPYYWRSLRFGIAVRLWCSGIRTVGIGLADLREVESWFSSQGRATSNGSFLWASGPDMP